MEAIWNKEYSLQGFVTSDQFKTYEELKTRLNYVLGTKSALPSHDQETFEEEQSFMNDNQSKTSDVTSSNEDDDTLSYFAKLAEE